VPPAPVTAGLRLGIDLGGTKIEGIALNGSREVVRRRIPTPRGDYDATIAAVAALVDDLTRRAGGRGSVGVGIPGTLSPATGLVKNANSVWLIGRPLQADLEARLGVPVRIANDANCFAVSEATDGAGAGAHVVFGVILGTGTGAGVVVGGRVITGPNGVAGEWGHNPLPWAEGEAERPGPDCYCGRRGCLETFLSGPGLAADHARVTGTPLVPDAIVAAAGAGDAAARATLDRYASRLARGLAAVVNVLDPDVVVLGGGLSNSPRLFAAVPEIWSAFVFGAVAARPGPPRPPGVDTGTSGPAAETVRTRLVRAAHGDASGVRGAAWLW
jgi:fructokinase